jgi:hypothetical protein
MFLVREMTNRTKRIFYWLVAVLELLSTSVSIGIALFIFNVMRNAPTSGGSKIALTALVWIALSLAHATASLLFMRAALRVGRTQHGFDVIR